MFFFKKNECSTPPWQRKAKFISWKKKLNWTYNSPKGRNKQHQFIYILIAIILFVWTQINNECVCVRTIKSVLECINMSDFWGNYWKLFVIIPLHSKIICLARKPQFNWFQFWTHTQTFNRLNWGWSGPHMK